MSVVWFNPEELGEIYGRLKVLADSDDEVKKIFADPIDKALGITTDEKIIYFMTRVIAGNQLAYHFTYSIGKINEFKIIMPDELDDNVNFDVFDFDQLVKFHDDLRHLRYNLVSNAGRMFISGSDEKILDFIISTLPTDPNENFHETED
jgi:hypothetical protein